MSHPAISVENLSKAYRIGLKDSMHDTLVGALKGALHFPLKNLRRLSRLDTFRHNGDAEDIFWALKDVSFEVKEGEVLGIIGCNGAGKSTLLKILSRITEPTSGRAVIRGRVSSLLEVGTGFHPELTGRENIYMNGTILGMTKREIDRKLDAIIDFSGVEKFLDTPVKRYSSGMKVRLAFSVAAHLEPEILIIDEVLAVGDAEFQRKCLGKMQDVADSGRTVLFVSHNMAAVQALCRRGVLLVNGSVSHDGSSTDTVAQYLASAHATVGSAEDAFSLCNGHRSSPVQLTSLNIATAFDNGTVVPMGTPITFEIGYRANGLQRDCRFRIKIRNSMDEVVAKLSTDLSPVALAPLCGIGVVKCRIPQIMLLPGSYRVSLVLKQANERIQDVENACGFSVVAADVNGTGRIPNEGVFLLPCDWS
jgi:lipopolysaccharide transport system ATP-binding protein